MLLSWWQPNRWLWIMTEVNAIKSTFKSLRKIRDLLQDTFWVSVLNYQHYISRRSQIHKNSCRKSTESANIEIKKGQLNP